MAVRPAIPAKVATRLRDTLKRFQPILSSALARDINESDTVTIVTDLLAELFGYDKFHEVTSEYVIRGTFCDLAVEIEGRVRLLLEVKAIGLDLKEKHLRQAANYAANQGIEWVVLTNGICWQTYKMDFGNQIREDLLVEFNLLEMSPKSANDLELLFLLTREGVMKSALPEFYVHKQATSRFVLGALMLTDPVITIIRRELKKISPGVKVGIEQIREVVEREVLKREVTEGEQAETARKKVQKAMVKGQQVKAVAQDPGDPPTEIPPAEEGIDHDGSDGPV